MSDDNAAVDTSCENEAAVVDNTSCCCASCGVAEVDDVKLKECTKCDLVRYCSIGCEQEDKLHHEEDCNKRAAELRDEILFMQPESTHRGDCPICFIPLPLDLDKSIMQTCCSKVICSGCNYANAIREIKGKLEFKCPFCRKPIPATNELADEMMMNRIEANDPEAMRQWGSEQYCKGDYSVAFEYFTKAAELGNAEAHYKLAVLYHDGEGVEKDERKAMHHLEEAAIGGHPTARYNLGVLEVKNGRNERAVEHWIIAANQGEDSSAKILMDAFRRGFIGKEDLAATLRAHQAAVDATKSPQREAAEKYLL
jgi:hypothetical protein